MKKCNKTEDGPQNDIKINMIYYNKSFLAVSGEVR